MDQPGRPEYRYVAYIDESGDPGIRRVKPLDERGSSEWLMVAGVIVASEHEAEIPSWIFEMAQEMASHQMRDIHFQKLSPQRKLIAVRHVAKRPVRCFVVASNKRNMRGHRNPWAEKIPSDNWFYCWVTRLLLERMTHWVRRRSLKDHGEVAKMKLIYSERGGLSYAQLKAYYEWLRAKGDCQFLPLGNIAYDTIEPGLMHVINHKGHDGLKLPDIVASAFFKAADKHDTGACDPRYALELEPRLARDDGQIAGYGVKLMPGYSKVRDRTAPEQLEIFRKLGYPAQWWDGPPGPSTPPPR